MGDLSSPIPDTVTLKNGVDPVDYPDVGSLSAAVPSRITRTSPVGDFDASGSQLLDGVYHLVVGRGLVDPAPHMQHNFTHVANFRQPAELERIFDLQVKSEPATSTELIKFANKVIDFSIKTAHPHFYNQLYGGIDKFSLAGAWLTDALNSSLATYETSPVFTIIERALIKYMGVDLIGYPEGELDGIFTPGGSSANTYAMVMARHRLCPELRTKGLGGVGRLVAFASEESHYSFKKSSIWLGMGTESVITVRTESCGRMDPVDLRKKIREARAEGALPYLVIATSGTTVLGAFDPLEPIAKVCQEEGNIWFHVDAAQGGACLFSPNLRALMSGISQSDSITWDWHKMTCVPFQCSLVVTRHGKVLTEANALKADYIFQADKYYDRAYDSGEKSIQCGRKVDSLKAWMWLSGHGQRHVQQLVENVWSRAAQFVDMLHTRDGFKLVFQPESNNICFWYVPRAWRHQLLATSGLSVDDEFCRDLRPSRGLSPELASRLHLLIPRMKRVMMERGKLMIGYQPLETKALPNFWRLTLTCTPETSRDHLLFVFQEIETIGEEVAAEFP